MNLNKYIAQAGIASRRKAVDLIKQGKVNINGITIKEPYYTVKPKDKVKVNGNLIKQERKTYIILNKPSGYVTTTSDEKRRRTVLDLIKVKSRVYPVGRLDMNTTGVLLLTNDGDFAQKLLHPKYEVKKVYVANLDKVLMKEHRKQIQKGVKLEDGFVVADDIRSEGKEAILTLHCGKNRVVKRIFKHFGYNVQALDRFNFAGLTKEKLDWGKWRYLTRKEVDKALASGKRKQ